MLGLLRYPPPSTSTLTGELGKAKTDASNSISATRWEEMCCM
jgi:hypothetical protein